MKTFTHKRIDILVDSKNNIKKRAFVSCTDNKLVIEYKKKLITSNTELKNLVNYEIIVVGDQDIVDELNKQGFKARSWDFVKVPLNVTIPKDLRAAIGYDAKSNRTTVTAVVENILNQHYND